jgi:hypothetical protein
VTGAEQQWWADQAALLDPLAYETLNGAGWKRTVPAGEAWYLVAAGSLDWGAGMMTGYVRPFDVRTSVMLPAGTKIGAAPGQSAAAHICRPALVSSGPRYEDPRALYFERLARLRSLPITEVVGTVADGAPHGTTAHVDLPADFDFGMVVGASVYDAAWVTLNGWNMLDEVNNDHSVRFARGLLAPFPRSSMPFLLMCGGARDGMPASTVLSGQGTVLFQKLPPGF